MEIEITTTKKKLSKSLVGQMKTPNIFQVQMMEPHAALGYMVGVVANKYKAMLLTLNGEYFTLSMDWKLGGISSIPSAYRKGRRGQYITEFESEEQRSEWWASYEKLLHQAIHQIYI